MGLGFLLLTLLAVVYTESAISNVVEIEQGQLLGIDKVGLDDVPYVSYMGIPYAKQPVGDLRFRPPEDPESWDEIRNATIERASCLQYILPPGGLIRPTEPNQEACLYINVHTPANCSDDNLPVFVWIHGGSFAVGSGNTDIYGPDYLISKGVIVVTFNFRLDVYGFLSLDIPEAPGNIALRDQVAALRWTQDNIAAFGGDPDAITVGGQSSGAAAVHLLALSPMCEGLFQRVILMSGGALHPWAISMNNTDIAFEMARKLNYTTNDATELYNLLRAANSSDIYHASVALLNEKGLVSFQPVVEQEFDGVEPFLTEHPYEILEAGNQNDVDYLIGFTGREGINLYNRLGKKWMPTDIDTTNLTSAEIDDIEYRIKSFYLGNQNTSDATIDQRIDWASQWVMQYKAIVAARIISNVSDSSVFVYDFAYDGNYSIIKTNLNVTGAPHSEDLGYIFKVNSYSGKIEDGSTDDMVRRATVEMWTNFIKYGDPTPETNDLIPVNWLPSSGFNVTCLKIDSTLSLQENPLAESTEFWDEIYTSVGIPIQ